MHPATRHTDSAMINPMTTMRRLWISNWSFVAVPDVGAIVASSACVVSFVADGAVGGECCAWLELGDWRDKWKYSHSFYLFVPFIFLLFYRT